MTFYIDTKKSGASRDISFFLKKCILGHPPGWNELVFLCIGTRSSYRRLPWTLCRKRAFKPQRRRDPRIRTLKKPGSRPESLQYQRHDRKQHPKALVIAIDASLGQKKHRQ